MPKPRANTHKNVNKNARNNRRNTRKVGKCSYVKQAEVSVRHGKTESRYIVNYYDTKSTTKDKKYISPIFDKCKQIYEIIEDDVWASDKRIVVRKLNNSKVILDIPQPSNMSGDAFYANGVDRSVSKSVIFNESDGNFTYVGHQVFSFKLLETIPNYKVHYYVYLTPSGIIKPYVEGKKYIYSLRDKVAALKSSLNLDMKKFMNEQLKEVDAKFKTVKMIPFPVTMIDAGME